MSIIEIGRNRAQLECVCKGKEFHLVVSPDVSDGSAKISELYCIACSRGVLITDGRIGTNNPDNAGKFRVDDEGRKHHSLKVDTLKLGNGLGKINN